MYGPRGPRPPPPSTWFTEVSPRTPDSPDHPVRAGGGLASVERETTPSEADVHHYHRFVPYAASSPGSFSRIIRQHSGIEDFHVHRCSHTFAMRSVEAGGTAA